MSSSYGKNIRITIFGQSHSESIGVCVEGLPPGQRIDMEEFMRFLARRAPGQNSYSTSRREADRPEFLSGLVDGVTCGAPLTAVIRNTDTRSSDYDELIDIPRPSHADYAAQMKYRGAQDVRGGGHFSGRLTAPLCIAGGICIQLLEAQGIEIGAHIASIGGVFDAPFDTVSVSAADFKAVMQNSFPVLSPASGEEMLELIEKAKREGDSVGGVIECAVIGARGARRPDVRRHGEPNLFHCVRHTRGEGHRVWKRLCLRRPQRLREQRSVLYRRQNY